MGNHFRFGTLLSMGVVSVLMGCVGEMASEDPNATMTAEQACLATHTDQGVMMFENGMKHQVCGASRLEMAGSRQTGYVLELPATHQGFSYNLDFIAVRLTSRFGGYMTLPRVASGSKCGEHKAWYWDNPKNPSKIQLCNCDTGSSIDAGASSQSSSGSIVLSGGDEWIDLLVGCGGAQSGSGTGTETGAGSNTHGGGSFDSGNTGSHTGYNDNTGSQTGYNDNTGSQTGTGVISYGDSNENETHNSGGGTDTTCHGGTVQTVTSTTTTQGGGTVTTTITVTESGCSAVSNATTVTSTATTGCSCLWNVAFRTNGCKAD